MSDATRLAAPRPGEAGSGLAPKRISAALAAHRGRRLYIQGFRNELRAPHFTQRVRQLLPLGRTAGEFVLTLHAQQPLLQLVT